MARKIVEDTHAERRKEILDAGLCLIYRKGYELMTIQDILDELQISKGALYHYFKSKADILEAIIDRMIVKEVEPMLAAIVDDPTRSALEKLHGYFSLSARWKAANKSLILGIMRVWVADENAIVRQKLMTMSLQKVVPLLSKILEQGVQEGVFNISHPEYICTIILYILLGMSDSLVELFLSDDYDRDPVKFESTMLAYTETLNDSMERLLGTPKGSMDLVDREFLKIWFEQPETTPAANSPLNDPARVEQESTPEKGLKNEFISSPGMA